MGATLAHFATLGQEQSIRHRQFTCSSAWLSRWPGSGFKSERIASEPSVMGRFSAAAFLNPTRADTRVTPRPGAAVEIQVMGRGTLDVLRARNVSQTGIGIYVAHDFAGCDLDETVELVITLPHERPFLTRGRIKHQTNGSKDGHHFGVHFSNLSPDHREKLRDYVRSLART